MLRTSLVCTQQRGQPCAATARLLEETIAHLPQCVLDRVTFNIGCMERLRTSSHLTCRLTLACFPSQLQHNGTGCNLAPFWTFRFLWKATMSASLCITEVFSIVCHCVYHLVARNFDKLATGPNLAAVACDDSCF